MKIIKNIIYWGKPTYGSMTWQHRKFLYTLIAQMTSDLVMLFLETELSIISSIEI